MNIRIVFLLPGLALTAPGTIGLKGLAAQGICRTFRVLPKFIPDSNSCGVYPTGIILIMCLSVNGHGMAAFIRAQRVMWVVMLCIHVIRRRENYLRYF